METKTLKQLREAKGLTQKQAAELLEINKCYLSRLENKDRNPSDGLKNKMAKVYDVSNIDIFLAAQLPKCSIK